MENPDLNADEKTARQLREIADAHERQRVDYLQRETLRTAAEIIIQLIELTDYDINQLTRLLITSQRREWAAVEDLHTLVLRKGECFACAHDLHDEGTCPAIGKCSKENDQWEWRGPQEAER